MNKVESSTSWLTALTFLVPLVGIIRKWYIDKAKLLLEARLENYSMLELFFVTRENAKKELQKRIQAMAN